MLAPHGLVMGWHFGRPTARDSLIEVFFLFQELQFDQMFLKIHKLLDIKS